MLTKQRWEMSKEEFAESEREMLAICGAKENAALLELWKRGKRVPESTDGRLVTRKQIENTATKHDVWAMQLMAQDDAYFCMYVAPLKNTWWIFNRGGIDTARLWVVEHAVRHGKPVPDSVLMDFPKLFAKYGTLEERNKACGR